jgi:regulator of protease activity HflC (stomatin/prohibitin superfamily)
MYDIQNFKGSISIKPFILVILGLVLLKSFFTIVGPGERGVVIQLGEVTGRVLDEGLNLKKPLIEKVVKMDVKVQRFDIQNGTAASKDGQSVLLPLQLIIIYNQIRLIEFFKLYQNPMKIA